MNKQELEQDLKTLGVEPQNYTLNGPPYKDSSWVLEAVNAKKTFDVWRVFNFERGKIYDEKLFNSENEACLYIYEKLREHHELFKKFGW